jgi:hypothetical protein
MRLLYDNTVDRATSIAASTTAGTLVASYMQNDRKGQAHRSTGTSVTYDLTWTGGVTIGGIGLPATNLTSTATIRCRVYSDTAMTTLVEDSGVVTACPGLNLSLWDWTGALNANAFAYGGASKTALWLTTNRTGIKGLKIDLVDTSNPAGYIDCARIVAGPYWEPLRNPAYGLQLTLDDESRSERTHAGDQLTDRGTRSEKMSLELRLMPESDRSQLQQILRNVGTGRNFLLSLLPTLGNTAEQDHIIYGKRASSTPVSFDAYALFGNRVDIASW